MIIFLLKIFFYQEVLEKTRRKRDRNLDDDDKDSDEGENADGTERNHSQQPAKRRYLLIFTFIYVTRLSAK